jgi:hypothetical protein
VFQDELPSLRISRLRATGAVTGKTTEFVVRLGDVEQSVGVVAWCFPNNGSWNRFICPCCGSKVQVLKVLDGAVICGHCCQRRGVRYRTSIMTPKQRAEHRIPKLKAMLASEESLRLKPVLWGKLERRKRLEAALARCEFVVSRRSRRYRGLIEQTPEVEPEPIARPKIKSLSRSSRLLSG